MDTKLIAKRIRQYRHLEKISQETLADLAGVSDTYIRKLEAGQRTPSVETIITLAAVLNTTPDHLLLPTSGLIKSNSGSIMELLNDCTPTEFAILYENMVELKELLRTHMR
ncbi:MAG: helix-turn-helix transcriptional regulator [Oscillospiraceae bacterium]|nr:helix-turn-helix transcriptional regulator [Oscillospiraceae bacterium]